MRVLDSKEVWLRIVTMSVCGSELIPLCLRVRALDLAADSVYERV